MRRARVRLPGGVMKYVGRPVCALAVVLSTAPPVLAQSRVCEGGVMPMMSDAYGAHLLHLRLLWATCSAHRIPTENGRIEN
jgi:hypothetical protein